MATRALRLMLLVPVAAVALLLAGCDTTSGFFVYDEGYHAPRHYHGHHHHYSHHGHRGHHGHHGHHGHGGHHGGHHGRWH